MNRTRSAKASFVLGILLVSYLLPSYEITAAQTHSCRISQNNDVPLPLPDGLSLDDDGTMGSDMRTFSQYILDNLNQGVSVEALSNQMGLPESINILYGKADPTDETEDIAVLIIRPLAGEPLYGELLLVALCDPDTGFQYGDMIYHSIQDYPGSRLVAFQDLNQDRFAEIVVESKSCGASTCFSSLWIYKFWVENLLVSIAAATDDWVFPSLGMNPLVTVENAEQDAYWEVVIRGEGYGSLGWGYYRPATLTWYFDPTLDLWLYQEQFAPSDMRIYVLEDADRLALHGRFAEAIMAYQAIISDNTLIDLVPIESVDGKPDNPINAYAYFRIVVLYTLQNQSTLAAHAYEEMQSLYSGLPKSNAFVELTRLFLDTYQEADSPCMGVQQALSAGTMTRYRVDLTNFSNEVYQTSYENRETLCPF